MEHKWWRETDPGYGKMVRKLDYIDAVYGADPDTLRSDKFLVQKPQGEHDINHDDRVELAMFVPFYAAIVDGYVGQLEGAERKIYRRWENDGKPGLGSPKEPGTIANRIWHNADGKGTNYLAALSGIATDLTKGKERVWVLVNGVEREGGEVVQESNFQLIDPKSVTITRRNRYGVPVEVVVQHWHTERASVYDAPVEEERFTVFSLDGKATYRIEERDVRVGNKVETQEFAVRIDGGEGSDPIPYGGTPDAPFYFYNTSDARMSDRILPIFEASLPTTRQPGYTLAHANVSIYNTYSELQNKHRMCNLISRQIPVTSEDEKAEIVKDLINGTTTFFISADSNRDVAYIEPDATSLKETREQLDMMKRDFLFSALRGYEDSVRGGQKTATEAAQDAAKGEHSYLNMLAGTLDETEMEIWKRIEQIEFHDNHELWGAFYVERKKDFRPMDETSEAKRLRETYFGTDPVPIGPTGQIEITKRIADLDETPYEESEVVDEVNRRTTARNQTRDLQLEFGV